MRTLTTRPTGKESEILFRGDSLIKKEQVSSKWQGLANRSPNFFDRYQGFEIVVELNHQMLFVDFEDHCMNNLANLGVVEIRQDGQRRIQEGLFSRQ